jgi:hypothetical protein
MKEKNIYGQLSAEKFNLGDIVEWQKWNQQNSEWETHYGVITDIKTKVMSNRLVCISTVLPIDGNQKEKDFFSMSLTLVSKATEKSIDTNC